MTKNTRFTLVGIVALFTCAAFYFSPHLAVHNMKKAAAVKDADVLSDYVDFPALRESLKANFNAMMASEVVNSSGNPFEALSTAIAAALINPMIDALVTPESLSIMMKGERPELARHRVVSKPQSTTETSNSETSMSYKGFNRFVIRVKKKATDEEPIEFIFKRSGLISWKLSALRLPSPPTIEKDIFNVELPREVKDQWKSVALSVNDKAKKNTTEYTIELNKELFLPDSDIRIVAKDYVPDFHFENNVVTTVSNDPINPALHVIIYEKEKTLLEGWLYQKFPSIAPFKHDRFSIFLKNGVKS